MEQKTFYEEAFSRNKGIISDEIQEKLKNTHVAIPGMGGVGGIHATTLARLGVGSFSVADGDSYELANFNRQTGAFISTIDKQKNEVMSTIIHDINPFAQVRMFGKISEENIDEFLEGVDIVVDGMDFFQIEVRRLIYRKAYEKMIPVVTAAPLGFGSSCLLFTKDSITFDNYFAIHDSLSEEEKFILFGIGLCPALLQRAYYSPTKVNFKNHKAPSTVLGTLAAANWVGAIVYKIVSGISVEAAPVSYHFDPYVGKVKRVKLYFGNRHPLQRFKFWFLKKNAVK
jgi:molybdopterin/thiamine biosynthesis adenylyltransferase